MKQSENITELLSSLAEIQKEIPTMPKNAKAYGYKYTDLDTITQTIKPILHNHNVGYLQSVGAENGLQTLTTRVFNTKGEWIEDTTVLPVISGTKNNAAQTLGMSITYMRRYMLSAMLGITSDEDIDANTFVQNQKTSNQSGQNQNKNPQTQNQKSQFKGGDSTEAEKQEIKNLCSTKYSNGNRVFSNEEIKIYSNMRTNLTAQELIALLKKEIQIRLSQETFNNEIF